MNSYIRLFRLVIFPGLLALGLAGCSQSSLVEPAPRPAESGTEEPVAVRVGAYMGTSRTEIDENGTDTRWSPGDRIALWALPEGGGSNVLEAVPFTLWHFDTEYPTAWFTANISSMAEGRYTYYASYPVPEAVSGYVAEYELPAVQNGTKDLSHGVMVARPAVGEALAPTGTLHLNFVHKLHVLKITVPVDKNLLGEPITRLDVDFSQPVVGRLFVDVSDAGAAVALDDNGASSVLRLEFPEPVNAGSTVYAVIAPTDLTGQTISFKAYSGRLKSQTITTMGKDFAAGHTTPIRLTVPPLIPTRLYFTIGTNHLGEAPESFTVRFTDGTSFPGGESEVKFMAADADASGRYEYVYMGNFDTDYSGKEFEVTFESAHAIVRKTFTMPAVECSADTTVAPLEVPYLLFENFDALTGEPSDNDDRGLMNYDATDLGGNGVPGWSISRAAGSAGKCLCLRHYETFRLNKYVARINSCALSALKPGSTVRIHVSFNAAAAKDHDINCHVGVFDASGKANPGTGEEISNPQTIRIPQNETYGSYGGMSESAPYFEYYMNGVTNTTALAWRTISCENGGGGFIYYDSFIDNIRVSIAQ